MDKHIKSQYTVIQPQQNKAKPNSVHIKWFIFYIPQTDEVTGANTTLLLKPLDTGGIF